VPAGVSDLHYNVDFAISTPAILGEADIEAHLEGLRQVDELE
jgi:hypothetical protein